MGPLSFTNRQSYAAALAPFFNQTAGSFPFATRSSINSEYYDTPHVTANICSLDPVGSEGRGAKCSLVGSYFSDKPSFPDTRKREPRMTVWVIVDENSISKSPCVIFHEKEAQVTSSGRIPTFTTIFRDEPGRKALLKMDWMSHNEEDFLKICVVGFELQVRTSTQILPKLNCKYFLNLHCRYR